VKLDEITSAEDPRLVELSALLDSTFGDPNTVLSLARLREFLAERTSSRRFHVLVLTDAPHVVGGSVFSYVPAANCGFSEYLVVTRELRGSGHGRALFDARKSVLDADAGHGGCAGLFIEVDSPVRAPATEHANSIDPLERLRIFTHLGFLKVDIAYVQPALQATTAAVDIMDLLFAPWHDRVLAREQLTQTLEAIWSAWSPETCRAHLERLRAQLLSPHVRLVDPLRSDEKFADIVPEQR
jgi:hypothetical protein